MLMAITPETLMKTIGMLFLTLALTACAQLDQHTADAPPGFSDEGVAAQARIGQMLEDAVVTPDFRRCWGQLAGEGAVAADLTYRKAGGAWVFEDASLTRSILPGGQDAAAKRCLDAAARGSTFAVDATEALEEAAPEFVVRLAFPVPLPEAGTRLADTELARMIGGHGAGGVITVPGCSDCVRRTEFPYGVKCVTKKSGSNVDCEEINSNTCATTPKACVRGAFGGAGGLIMY